MQKHSYKVFDTLGHDEIPNEPAPMLSEEWDGALCWKMLVGFTCRVEASWWFLIYHDEKGNSEIFLGEIFDFNWSFMMKHNHNDSYFYIVLYSPSPLLCAASCFFD